MAALAGDAFDFGAELEERALRRSLERRESGWLFHRVEVRHSRLPERDCDCGHTIGASEPYRYIVGKLPGARRLFQRRDCDVCMRRDARY